MTKVLQPINGSWLAMEVLYVVLADGQFDVMCDGVVNTMRHMEDLKDMEVANVHAVRITSTNEGWAHLAAGEIEEHMMHKPFGRKALRAFNEDYVERELTIRLEWASLAGLRKEMMERVERQAIEF